MAILIKAPGSLVRVAPANGRAFSLIELQRFVGGYIEMVRARGRRRYLVLNEDGKRLDLPVNIWATILYHEAGGATFDAIVGDVVLATFDEVGGDDGRDLDELIDDPEVNG